MMEEQIRNQMSSFLDKSLLMKVPEQSLKRFGRRNLFSIRELLLTAILYIGMYIHSDKMYIVGITFFLSSEPFALA
jgi:hypothetical protein